MHRRHLLTLAGLSALAHVPRAQAQAFTMKLSSTASADLDIDWLNAYKAQVEAASLGRVKGQVYPASQLGSAQRTIEGVSMGTVEMVLNASGMYEGLDPRFGALAVPGVFDSLEHGIKVLADPAVRERLAGIAAGKGVQLLTTLVHSPCSIVSRKPVRTLADLKGQKIRVPGSASLVAQLRQLGANPVAMSLGEVLPAFQNGTLDGVYSGTPIPSALKYFDVAKAQTLLPSTYIAIVGLVSSSFLQQVGPLAPALREAARRTDAETAPRVLQHVQAAEAAWRRGGGEMLQLPPADAQAYLAAVVPAARGLLGAEALRDYETLRSAAARHRA
ncbi:TRAP transporter substrate-binding protein [Pseudorhodoferax sp.]|uniref:TRAP transporter substrate-binding protein n=1 Tax=Pseudorhodoferax sp. TaxID=1993553 RepID=UPI002DD6AC5D|nr:TRAP transporter substrate-binding protein [Pseudorhodoferax sp.]